jgi:hypothetical protein
MNPEVELCNSKTNFYLHILYFNKIVDLSVIQYYVFFYIVKAIQKNNVNQRSWKKNFYDWFELLNYSHHYMCNKNRQSPCRFCHVLSLKCCSGVNHFSNAISDHPCN